MNSDIRFYISIFFRRFHVFALVAGGITVAAVIVALRLPAVYTSESTLLIESSQIPDDLASSTVRTAPGEQLGIIEQRLMTREYLLDLADRYGIFEDRENMFPDQVVTLMREQTTFAVSTGRDRATIVDVSFNAGDPQTAAAVVNAYVTKVLEDNVEIRTGRAEETLDFFEQEVARLSGELAEKSKAILDFSNENIDALPDSLEYRLERQSTLEERLAATEREIASLGQQRERLILVFNATGGFGANAPDPRSPEEIELDRLRDELADALAILSEQNPRVRVLRARIAALEEVIASRPIVTDGDEPAERPTVLDVQLSEIDDRIGELNQQRADIREEIAALEASIDATPANAIALASLEREYENIQEQYNTAVARLSTAATGERIELLSKGERISVINQPNVPREPSSPNRRLIAALGLVIGVGAGASLVLILEILNRSIRRPADITNALGIVPLATLPMIRTPGERIRRGAVVGALFLLIAGGIPLALFVVHYYYLPLDLVYERAKEIIRS